jgi:hypothetical protein
MLHKWYLPSSRNSNISNISKICISIGNICPELISQAELILDKREKPRYLLGQIRPSIAASVRKQLQIVLLKP